MDSLGSLNWDMFRDRKFANAVQVRGRYHIFYVCKRYVIKIVD